LRRKKEKEAAELKNEIDRLKNEKLITEKSLESIVRGLMETVRKIYARLRRVLKKKGKEVEDQHKLFESPQVVQVNALKIDEAFEEVLGAIEHAD
jgi:HSP90 family molecular chaperone